jgi:hypothetical protein
MNNIERRLWILNDEGLFDWWRTSRLSMAEFIQQNRKEIDAAIAPVVEGKKPSHYLKYGGSMGAVRGRRLIGGAPSRRAYAHSIYEIDPGVGEFIAKAGQRTLGPWSSLKDALNGAKRITGSLPDRVEKVVKVDRKAYETVVAWEYAG